MGSTELVAEKIQAGARLVEELDRQGTQVGSAFWLRDLESDDWRLFLSMPLVEARGVAAAYEAIRKALSGANITNLYLREIAPVGPKDHVVHLLRSTILTGPVVADVRLASGGIKNVLVNDAYIYRST